MLENTFQIAGVMRLADLTPEDLGHPEGVGLLTQLLGPDRPTAQEQQKGVSNWKTKQRESACPGEHWYSAGCIPVSTECLASGNISYSPLQAVVCWQHLRVLACTCQHVARRLMPCESPLMHTACQ